MPFSPLLIKSILILSAGFLAKVVLQSHRKVQPGLQILNYDAKSISRGIKDVYSSPRQWQEKEFLILAAMTSSILLFYQYDEEISRWFRKRGETVLPVLKDFGWYYGSPENHYVINAGFYLYGFIFRKEEVRKTGVLLITSSLAAGILQTVLKVLIGRARPLRDEGKFSFNPWSRENSYYSFPSGHSILSFTTAYAVATQIKQPAFKAGLYAFGAIAPFSRLWAGAHWLTDALTSILISIPLVNRVDKFLNEKRHYPSGMND